MNTTELKTNHTSGYYNLSGQWISKSDIEEANLSKQAYISRNCFLEKFSDIMNNKNKHKREK